LYRALKISKQAVHKGIQRLQQTKDEQMQVLKLIYEIRSDHPTMGMRDMYYKMRPKSMGRDAFERFCNEWSLQSRKAKNHRRTTDSSGVVRFENLINAIECKEVNHVWQSDITYFEVRGIFYYITFIQDAFSRRIIGHHTSKRLFTEDTTLPALKKAIKVRQKLDLAGLIFHSDGGGQYYDKAFLELTQKNHIQNSMCEYAWENGKAERLNGVIKNNYLQHRSINNFEELVKEVDRSVHLYNEEKPHIALQRKSPTTFEKELIDLGKQTKPKMKESLDAKRQIFGASSP
jgi:putative transposase